jgi:cold shock CspA family protein
VLLPVTYRFSRRFSRRIRAWRNEPTDMAEGAVKRFKVARDYTVVTPDDSTSDVFPHFSSWECSGYGEFTDGQKVSLQSAQRFPHAKRVRAV